MHSRRLPRAQSGARYRADLVAVGGVEPTTWKRTSGRLPRGLRLDSAIGRLTGIPTKPGTYVFALEVRDGLRARDGRTFRVVVAQG